jgi:hypothetical protein
MISFSNNIIFILKDLAYKFFWSLRKTNIRFGFSICKTVPLHLLVIYNYLAAYVLTVALFHEKYYSSSVLQQINDTYIIIINVSIHPSLSKKDPLHPHEIPVLLNDCLYTEEQAYPLNHKSLYICLNRLLKVNILY